MLGWACSTLIRYVLDGMINIRVEGLLGLCWNVGNHYFGHLLPSNIVMAAAPWFGTPVTDIEL